MNTLRLDTVDSKLDYFVDDLPLWDWIALVTGEETFHGRRSTTPFGAHATPKAQRKFYQMLVGKQLGDVSGGRVPLYVCECCTDYACGVSSIMLTQTGATVRWREFAPFTPEEVLVDVPELVFDKVLYLSALSAVA